MSFKSRRILFRLLELVEVFGYGWERNPEQRAGRGSLASSAGLGFVRLIWKLANAAPCRRRPLLCAFQCGCGRPWNQTCHRIGGRFSERRASCSFSICFFSGQNREEAGKESSNEHVAAVDSWSRWYLFDCGPVLRAPLNTAAFSCAPDKCGSIALRPSVDPRSSAFPGLAIICVFASAAL